MESTIQWTEKIKSDSAVRDPLGLWTDHLEIQVEFTPGITSVTDRIRYYTNLAWYWKNLSDTISPAELEKIFILKCLSHHNGNSKNPHLGNVFNKTRFDGEWQQKSSFDLKFKINGFGKSYYNSQLEILRCAWTDFAGNAVLSPINDKLASSLSQLVPGDFERQTFSKDFLKNHFDGLCICDSTSNKKEIDIMSKLFFGFFSLQNGDWDIDDSEFERFLRGKIELDFENMNSNAEPELELEGTSRIRLMNLLRRNTLFLFLKTIEETTPERDDMKQTIWDATYFGQNSRTKRRIDFGRLERARQYWEFFQLNVYYVYAIESVLDALQRLISSRPGLARGRIVDVLDTKILFNEIDQTLGGASKRLSISQLFQGIWNKIGTSQTSLSSPINESSVFDLLTDSEEPEGILANVVLMLALLRKRYVSTEARILQGKKEARIIEDRLSIARVLGKLLQLDGQLPILDYLRSLMNAVIERHLFESAVRLSWGTTNWIFTEEQGSLYPARTDLVFFDARDNRWTSILHLLRDTEFVSEDNRVKLTQKGSKWLQLIE